MCYPLVSPCRAFTKVLPLDAQPPGAASGGAGNWPTTRGVEDVYRTALPQLSDEVFLTDSGLETDLIFHGGFDLPEFAAFVLVDDARGTAALDAYFRRMWTSRCSTAAV
jgi:hypothetical protein